MRAVGVLAGVVLAVVAVTATLYLRDMTALQTGLAQGAFVVPTRHGPVQVAVRGEGTPTLVLHGAGGGYDQGLLMASMFGGTGHRWIAVSRFGYLGTPMPRDASVRAQAEALVDVLDALDVNRAGVLAMSGGVPPALQLAALYPDRVSGMALLSSAPFAPLTAAVQDLPMPAWAYGLVFATDAPLWGLVRVAPGLLDPALDVRPDLRRRMTPQDAADVQALAETFLPVTARRAGLANEAAAIDPAAKYDLGAITAPVLIVHARDDGINPFPVGEYLAAQLPGARFLVVPDGGHLLLGHRDAIAAAVSDVLARR